MSKIWAQMVRSGEGLQVEFKVKCPKLLRLAKTFSAFANSAGGCVFFGVDDEGQCVGLEHVRGTRELVDKVAGFYCEPPVRIEVNEWEPMRGIQLLVVTIAEAQDKPVYAINPQDRKDAWPFFRSESENLPLDKKSLKTMRRIPSQSLAQAIGKMDRKHVQILEYLHHNPRVTIGRIAKSANISSHRVKKVLVYLEQNGWVHSFFNEKRREYALSVPWVK